MNEIFLERVFTKMANIAPEKAITMAPSMTQKIKKIIHFLLPNLRSSGM
jgi:hypothetical protein